MYHINIGFCTFWGYGALTLVPVPKLLINITIRVMMRACDSNNNQNNTSNRGIHNRPKEFQ